MKCEWPECTKRARIQTSMSGGQAHRLCFRHTFLLLKSQIKRLGEYDFGIYLQQVVLPQPKREIAPEARHAITTPEDRERMRYSEDPPEWHQDHNGDWNF